MPPSPVSGNSSRHGRSRHGGSVAKKTRGRGYSVAEDRETIVTKALTFVMKRTVTEDEEQAEGDEKLVADEEGWVDVDDLVSFTPHRRNYPAYKQNNNNKQRPQQKQ